MSSFESSLRSSVKTSSPKPNSRKNKTGNMSTPLRQSLLGQGSESGYKAAPLIMDRNNTVWEPPLSCQRSPMSILSDPKGTLQEQMYFPIELTSGEYVSRVYRLFASLLVSICKNKGNIAVRDSSVNAKVDSFLVLLSAYSQLIINNKLVIFNELKTFAFEPHMDLMVDVHAKEVSLLDVADVTNAAKVLSETGKLADMTTFYTSVRALVEGLLQTNNSKSSPDVSQCGQRVLHDLDHLEQQHKLHRVFKDQRMVAMGWLWPSAAGDAAASPAAGLNDGQFNKYSRSPDRLDTGGSNSSSLYDGGEFKSGYHNVGSLTAAGPDVKRVEAAKSEAEEVSAQLRALLQPTTLATVQLFHRLVSIVQDLDVLMRALSADNEYQEAQRLRELKAVIDATITRQGRALLDQVKQCCTQAQLLAAELRHYCEDCKQRGAYYLAAQECEAVARELLAQQAELRTNGVAPFSLLSQPSVVQRLQAEGSAFVTSNFLFSEPHLQQGMRVATTGGDAGPQSPVRQQNQLLHQTPLTGAHTAAAATGTGLVSIGSLLIRAGSNSVLQSILSTWPGLTALNSTNNNNYNNNMGNVSMNGSYGAPVGSDNNSLANGFGGNASFGSPSGMLSSALYHNNNAILSPVQNNNSSGLFSPYATNRSLNATPSNTLTNPANLLHQSHFTFPDEMVYNNSFQPSEQFTGFNSNESHDAVGFSAVEHYNQVGFSPTILTVLMSFEELQQQLKLLLSPASMALTALMQRFIGMSADLLHLSQRNHLAGQYAEGDRVLALRAAVEASIDADLRDNSSELVCGRGRRRLDNLQVLLQQVQTGSRELQRLAIRSRSESDFTGAQALEAVSQELVGALNSVERSLAQGVFSLLDSESGTSATEGGVEINEIIAREGTGFITADYLFQFTSGREGHSIGSLAIVAGAGAVLRHIRAEWPHLTALSAPQYGMPQLPSHGEESQLWATATAAGATQVGGGSNGSVSGGAGNNSVLGGSPLNGTNAAVMNFRDAASLRLLGFDAHSLRLAGFSDISIVTAGYTAGELRNANFSTEQLRAAGLNESALRVVGYQVEQQSDVLASLYRATEGSKWTSSAGWRDLLRMRRGDLHSSSSSFGNGSAVVGGAATLAQQLQAQQSQATVLKALEGIKCDDTTGDVIRLCLSGNNLKGQLPVGLGTLTSLTQLVLSHNQLSGHLPACLGQLVHLENLHLDNNNFEGEIPKSLKSLEHLVVLKLENNKLSGSIPAVLGHLHRLRRLDLSNNQLTGAIPARLTQLAQLQELLLFGNQLSGVLPETVGQWISLTSLQLQNNCLQGYIPASIARLTKLTGINIQHNPDLIVDRLQLQRALPRCRIKM